MLRNLNKNGDFSILTDSIYLITILDWQIAIKIKKIINKSIDCEFHNIPIKLRGNPENKIIFNAFSLFSLKTQLMIETNRGFLAYFLEKESFKWRNNVFQSNIANLKTLLMNYSEVENSLGSSCFYLKKIAILVKISDNLLANCLFKVFSQEIRPFYSNIYLNVCDLLYNFTIEDEILFPEIQHFLISLTNQLEKAKKLLIFLDFRDISILKSSYLRLLDLLPPNIHYFLLIPPQITLNIPLITLDFTDPSLFTIFIDILTKDLMITDINMDNRNEYIRSLGMKMPIESLKNIMDLTGKMEKNIINSKNPSFS